MENTVVANINKIIFTEIGDIKNIVPLAVKELEKTNTCIDHPCTTCAAKNMERTFLHYINSYIQENPDLKNISRKKIFEEALCKMDMEQLKKINKKVIGGFYGGQIPFWVKVIRNLSRNDKTNPRWLIFLQHYSFLDFDLNFKRIYKYWINNCLNEIELLDFMIYYDRFVPKDKKEYLVNEAKTMLKNNYNRSLVETLAWRSGVI